MVRVTDIVLKRQRMYTVLMSGESPIPVQLLILTYNKRVEETENFIVVCQFYE